MADPTVEPEEEFPSVIPPLQDADPIERTIDPFLNPLREVVEELRSLAAERHNEFTSRSHVSDMLRSVAAGEAYQLATAADQVAVQVHELDKRLRVWIEGQQALDSFADDTNIHGIPLPASLDVLRATLAGGDAPEVDADDPPAED